MSPPVLRAVVDVGSEPGTWEIRVLQDEKHIGTTILASKPKREDIKYALREHLLRLHPGA